jgi:hypothetical protein
MNDDLAVGSVTIGSNGDYGVITASGIAPISINTATNTFKIATQFDIDDFLDEHIMNRVTCDHKVAGHELLKLKEVAPDYANEIKENLAKNVTRDIMKKVTFTKKLDKDADVHHFIGRVWVFTEDELKNLINEARNV